MDIIFDTVHCLGLLQTHNCENWICFIRDKAGNVPAHLGSLEDASLKHWTSDRTNLSFFTAQIRFQKLIV
jgi:hypothetical protein